jgi:hypothetical protein
LIMPQKNLKINFLPQNWSGRNLWWMVSNMSHKTEDVISF